MSQKKHYDKVWQEYWEKNNIYTSHEEEQKPKFYVLDMFPYPSGVGLHVGHPKGYIATDVIARKKMLEGYNVLHPMGWDAFGLPAENYAIKNKIHPKISTQKNVKTFKEQLQKIGFTYDWTREVNTTDPAYYKWTQWIFCELYKHYFDHELQKARPISELPIPENITCQKKQEKYIDAHRLAYLDYRPINWCSACKTSLANEDLEDGNCERCGGEIEQRPMKQWMLRITDYAERLLTGLNDLPQWEKPIKEMQKNWIGRSEGCEFIMKKLVSSHESADTCKKKGCYEGCECKDIQISVYTTRVDTVFGMTYVVLAPEHPNIENFITGENRESCKRYIEKAGKKTSLQRTGTGEREKTGVFTGSFVINPFNHEKVPVWIADYVLVSYGTGAVMAVPAHDERDFAFAQKYNIEIRQSVAPYFHAISGSDAVQEDVNTKERTHVIGILKNPKNNQIFVLDWEKLSGKGFIVGKVEAGESLEEAITREVQEETGYQNIKIIKKLGGEKHNYFYTKHKKENKHEVFHSFYLELEDSVCIPSKKEKIKNHRGSWIDESSVENFINLKSHIHTWYMHTIGKIVFTDNGVLVNSGEFNGLKSKDAREKLIRYAQKNRFGDKTVHYKLQDWTFSRQRYWGEPIPVSYTLEKEKHILEQEELPLELPNVENYEPTGTQDGPLANIHEWMEYKKGGKEYVRESNTMPQWAGSSWYWLRYMDPKNPNKLVDPEKEKYWGQVDVYVGGAEHATRHLIYARFWHKFLKDIGVVSTEEPFKKLQHVGLILAEDGRKMSKRWGNVINPDDIIQEYGADALRVYEMFMGPFGQEVAWNTQGLKGAARFLEKVKNLSSKVQKDFSDEKKVLSLLHKTIKKVTQDIDEFLFNTAIACLMECVNELTKQPHISQEVYQKLILLISPFSPHTAEEIFREIFGEEKSIYQTRSWPKYNENMMIKNHICIVIQINGKVRSQVEVDIGMSQEDLEKIAFADKKIQKWIQNKKIIKKIFVPKKLLNFVIN